MKGSDPERTQDAEKKSATDWRGMLRHYKGKKKKAGACGLGCTFRVCETRRVAQS